ncbi:hypothetical protein [Streptomyces griseiscabiei]|uniref:Uncharacterized protein n=1 Tax=Streptomyces griseiscabiei TaxID=2993540 RepID=A0ABU4L7W0_9ACTN|nr:hypothetical protein [Streptomyces griseiscabiei]MBZ3906818.1 hypothetical protein [Streptomyces griseiscabiei]MDX2911804.1 hypothetical protein [Streptomyces griseiscabiei]
MTVVSTESGPLGRYQRLFDPGQRLGWIHRDPESLRQPFVEPEPEREELPAEYDTRVEAARLSRKARLRSALAFGVSAAVVCYLLSLLVGPAVNAISAAVIAFGAAHLAYASWQLRSATRARAAQKTTQEQRFQHAWQSWHQRRQFHESHQQQWIGGMDAWGTLPYDPDTRRLDIFGGSQRGREGFLSVFGTSTLRHRPLIVLDLTQALICRELSVLAEVCGLPVDVQLLPSRMAESGIVSALAPHELVQALVEAMNGDNAESGRAERAVYARVLTQVCGVLGADVSLARLGAGLRVLIGEDDDTKVLSRDERNIIADDLFSDKNKDQIRDSLFRLVSFVDPLVELGTARGGRGPGYLTCVALDPGAGSASTELLADLAVQSVMRRLSSFEEAAPSVIVALGEQGLQRRHLEQLAQVCERHGAQLTFVHAHLRDAGEQLIGGGTVGFMRLGNHQEAMIAADFMGRHHSFVLHTLTDTEGRTVNTSIASTLGSSTSRGTTQSSSVTRGRNSSSTYQGAFNPLSVASSTNSGRSHSTTSGVSTTVTHGTNESTTRTTGESDSTSLATGRQRVYEYALEPTQLQALAEFSLLVVERQAGGAVQVHAGDCNPNIVLLDRVSTQPFPQVDTPPQQHSPAPAERASVPQHQPHTSIQPPVTPQQPYPPTPHQPAWPSPPPQSQPPAGRTPVTPPNQPGHQGGGFR